MVKGKDPPKEQKNALSRELGKWLSGQSACCEIMRPKIKSFKTYVKSQM